MDVKTRRKQMVKTADRTLDVIELFAREKRSLTLSEIAALLSMPVSSSHGLIKTLQARGYLYELGRRQGYYPTRKLAIMVAAITAASPLLQTLAPVLSALRDATHETVVLGKRQGDGITYLDVFECVQSVRFSPEVGEFKPLHCTASGKAILSTLSPAQLEKTLSQLDLKSFTDRTLTDTKLLTQQIAEGQKKGWQFVLGEHIPMLMSIAAPIQVGADGYVVAIGGPIERFRPLMEQHASKLMEACAAIERLTR